MFRVRIVFYGAALATLFSAMAPLRAQTSTPDPFIAYLMKDAGSGTSAEPASTPDPMLMTMHDGWMLMAHGLGFVTDTQQTGPRGADKLFSTNWIMGMAEHRWGPGQLTLRTMLSLESATITERRYPLLFQTGETAYGRPLVDAQHPHNFFMELAALYDVRLDPHTLLTFYAAPMGDPAIGPTAFPHRTPAYMDPLAALGHHLEDSTHISADVFTAAVAYRMVRIEGSVFHGREPNENRWQLLSGTPDSYSWRLTANPAPNWSGQVSWAHIHSPEALNPLEDQIRITASVMYNRPLASGNWANIALWGRTRDVGGGNVLNGYLLESNLGLGPQHFWTRLENVDRTDDLLLGGEPQPPGFEEKFLARVQAYSFGYGHDLPSPDWALATLGAQWTLYHAPASLTPIYGPHPQGVAMFLRLRLGPHGHAH